MAKPKTARSTTPSEVSVNGTTQPLTRTVTSTPSKKTDYSSEGVVDHDVFLLPGSDYQIMLALTFLAAAIRLFRIYQPSSVVFDEVQLVSPQPCVNQPTNNLFSS
jgi:dolichyl-phosphate-mannose-protein mannosyltransferase